jgi:hypothetical protein
VVESPLETCPLLFALHKRSTRFSSSPTSNRSCRRRAPTSNELKALIDKGKVQANLPTGLDSETAKALVLEVLPAVCTENLDSDVLVMQPANQSIRYNASNPLNWARDRRILFQ